jgi:hypothetical protein
MSDQPPPKHTEHGNYARADWFEARCNEIEAARTEIWQRWEAASNDALEKGVRLRQLRELVALQAQNEALWCVGVPIGEAYVQQALRYLHRAIEGEWAFEQAREAIKEMAP